MDKIMKLMRIAATALTITALCMHSASQVINRNSESVTAYNPNEQTVRLNLPEPLNKGTLPAFSLRDRNAENRFQARQLQRMTGPETKRIALIFFATWCAPCAQGAMRLGMATNDLKRNGVLPVFINIGERDIAAVNNWVDRYAGRDIARFIDVRSQAAGLFGLLEPNGQMITPKTLVLDKNLKPLFLLGEEGIDYPQILWQYNP